MRVTIAVCTYNRAEMLTDALQSLMALESSSDFQHEILVVDNASTDATPQVIARSIATSPVPLRAVYERQPGVAAARNRAIATARGEWIAFFDDDQIADPNWLTELVAIAREKNLRCVGGAVRLRLPENAPQVSRHCRAQLGESVGLDEPMPYHLRCMPGTGNLLIHGDVFRQIGRFDETLNMGAEDSDLFLRIFQAEIPAWYTPRAIVRHVIPAYRLQPNYLRWTCCRTGAARALRDRKSHSLLGISARLAARATQIAFVGIMQWLPARLRGDQATALGWQCRMWRAIGYVRSGLQLLAPRLFRQHSFSNYLDFRSERAMLSDVAPLMNLSDAAPDSEKKPSISTEKPVWANS